LIFRDGDAAVAVVAVVAVVVEGFKTPTIITRGVEGK